MRGPLIIAHRTCPRDGAENSVEGIRVAAEKGADGVEIDLRMTLDQRPFLMHDWTMRRTTGWPLPIELTPSFLVRRQRLPNREGVPSLGDVIDSLPADLMLAVDVKTPWAIVPLLREMRRRGLGKRVLVWCTSALAVRYAASRAPEAEIAYLKDVTRAAEKQAFLARAKSLGARAVSAHWLAVDADFVAAAHAIGLRVYAWHSEYALTEEKLSAGLDGLITDYPVEARAAVAGVRD
jgi:glycerophosphoryl diester phosphodiesterase